jgi:hypothetical protein
MSTTPLLPKRDLAPDSDDKDGSVAMSEQAFNRPADAEAEIELLACATHMPRELVRAVYSSERAKLERTARIKTYPGASPSPRQSPVARATPRVDVG